jgi:hypothetical protein
MSSARHGEKNGVRVSDGNMELGDAENHEIVGIAFLANYPESF